ncbi:DNA-binding transcriptional LysR family regulator [Crossiella equi]|uniref:DNA-binding transcriptional LysR family regulator n=1 Tax=Crossiella equi TaxID=130796 RepID=A0ABS5APN5_9PSEU|nr:LysR family transcriptional regulator [Crossiella equi]MBP2478529.1 DNA-binding transcriptional LysR family regulator [Crossiella equi]
MNLKFLEGLLAVHQTGSFVEAAKRLGVSQPAISMQIKALESELGVCLFDRSVRPLALTAKARALIDPCAQVVDLVRHLRGLAVDRAPADGTLHVGSVHTLLLRLLPQALGALAHEQPDLVTGIRGGQSDELLTLLRRGELDIAVLPGPLRLSKDLCARPVDRDRLVWVEAATRPRRRRWTGLPFLRLEREPGLGFLIDQFLADAERAPARTVELDSVEAILALVGKGLGTTILPESALPAVYRQELLVRAVAHPLATRTITLVHRRDEAVDRAALALVGALRRAARPEVARRRSG